MCFGLHPKGRLANGIRLDAVADAAKATPGSLRAPRGGRRDGGEVLRRARGGQRDGYPRSTRIGSLGSGGINDPTFEMAVNGPSDAVATASHRMTAAFLAGDRAAPQGGRSASIGLSR